MKATILIMIAIVGLIAGGYGLQYVGLQWYKWYAPQKADAERVVFKKTRSFNEGKSQELSKLRMEYLRAKADGDDTSARSIMSVVRHTFADYDRTQLTPQLQTFLNQAFNTL